MYSEEKTGKLIRQTKAMLEKVQSPIPDKQEQAEEIAAELRDVIPFHDYRYYILADPVIADSEYDQLFTYLKKLEEKFPGIKTDYSPTQRIPAGITKSFPSVRHIEPMLSLDNSYSREDLAEFDKRVKKRAGIDQVEYTAEPKFDGTGISLVYTDDVLQRAVTRGDGTTGEEITPNIKILKSVPLQAGFSEMGIQTIEIRGEVLMEKASFKKLNEQRVAEGKVPFANPRNATAGTLRLQDAGEVAKRNLRVFSYHISYAVDKEGNLLLGNQIKDYISNIERLHKMGFLTPVNEMKRSESIETIQKFCRDWEDKRDAFPYEVDGMVVKVNNIELYEKLGSTSHHPRWAIAYKFKARQGTSELLKVEFQVGRVGNITPVAKIKPVQIGGVTVSSVSMFNEDFINEKDIRIGDQVLVERAGDVIPYIVKPIVDARTGDEKPIRFPESCPSCNEQLVKLETESLWRCTNAICPAQSLHKLIHFVSKNAMDIDGMGESIVRKFTELGIIKRIPDIYRMDYERIGQLEGFGEKSAENLRRSVESSKDRPIHLLLFGMGIRFAGKTMAKKLSKAVNCITDFFEWTEADYLALHDAGPRLAESMTVFFRNEENQKMIHELKELGVRICHKEGEVKPDTNGKLEGLTFLFTGTLQKMTRKEASELVENNGGKVISAVSNNLNYLVAGENAGSKLKKARETEKVQIIDEAAFLELLNE